MSVMIQDVRYALRSLSRAPGFTLVALITLALGIGGTTAIFSVVDGILLRPLPYPEPDSIVRLSRLTGAESGGAFSPADYLDYRRGSRSFAALAAFREQIIDLTGRGDPTRLTSFETTSAFFDVFGRPPVAGRFYSEASDRPGAARVAVMSEALWRRQFGSAPDVVGSIVRLNGNPTTVIGIAPAAFVYPNKVDLWMLAPREVPTSPLALDGELLDQRDVNYFQAVGRLARGVTMRQAREELRVIGDRLAREYPDSNDGEGATVDPLQESLVGDVRNALLILMGAVAFVLLIACANVASLLLARGTGRRRELAVRSALGASRGRLVRQLLTESVVLAAAGGALGLLVAYWGVDLLVAIAPESIPRLDEVALNTRIGLAALISSSVVGMLFGLIPALQGARRQMTDALKDGGRTGTARTWTRSALVVAEIALSLVLLIGAGLMLTSFARLRSVDPGFTAHSLVIASVPVPQARYDTPRQAAFYQQLYERLQENPVTARSALVFPSPFGGSNAVAGYQLEGAPPRPRAERSTAQLNAVSPGYFQTMGVRLLRGRDLSFADKREGQGVVVVNRTMAEREWPNQDPIGKRIVLGGNPEDPNSRITVVGVVADSKRSDLDAPVPAAVYLSLSQFTLPFMSVVTRTDSGEAAVASAVRSVLRSLDPELPIDEVKTIERVLAEVTGQPRFRAVLIASFAAVALILAAVGLYGLISFTVAQRVPEIGVRLALGATPSQVARLVVGQGVRLAIAGVVIGIGGAVAMARVLKGLLFSVSATDPVVYGAIAILLLSIAALACYVPARRAMRIDPMTALRAE